MRNLPAWFEERTGLCAWWDSLRRPAAGGAALASAIGVLLLNQALTGACLAAYYKPTAEGAYSSVELILYELRFGWLLRSLHLWGQHLLVLALLFALVRAFALRRYEKPRELTWLALAGLFFAVLGAGQTGQVLPLDEDGWNGALVGAGLAGPLAPAVLGGSGVSDLTVGRYAAAHFFFLPGLWALLFWGHRVLERRRPEGVPSGTVLERAGLAAIGTVALAVTLAVLWPLGLGPKGSALAATASARPHWYLLPVYQGLKFLDVGAMRAALGGIAAFLVAVPLLPRRLAVGVGALVLAALVVLGAWGAVAK